MPEDQIPHLFARDRFIHSQTVRHSSPICAAGCVGLISALVAPSPFISLTSRSASLSPPPTHTPSSPSHRALRRVFGGNRTLMLTRSSFPGVGKYSGHWLGDNAANWNDIKWAIPGMLEFGLFGIPYVSRICQNTVGCLLLKPLTGTDIIVVDLVISDSKHCQC